MRYLVAITVACSLLAGDIGAAQDSPRTAPVGIVELLASPQKYEGKQVTVRGFLLMLGGHHDIGVTLLCPSKEDGENELGDDVLVVANQQMLRDREKLDRMYVSLTGSVAVIRGADGSYAPEIKDIKDCSVWSDPSRPRLLQPSAPKASVQR
jgi:hypothetical protein